MRNNFFYTVFVLILSSFSHTYSEDTAIPELSDAPQTLPAPDAIQSTEILPEPSAEPSAVPEIPEAPEVPAAPEKVDAAISPIQNKVVSEDELLKPNPKKVKEKNKSKSKDTTETEIYIEEANKYKLNESFKQLYLNDVIEQGLRKNYSQNILGQKDVLNDISFQGTKNAFWLPELKINLTTSNQKMALLYQGKQTPSTPNPNTPTGALSLSLGNYTVFNWGKDYALYLNKKSLYSRQKQIFEESKRDLKLDLIANFFSLMTVKKIDKIRQEQLRHASFIYRLNKEKITIGKTSKQDYYLARSEYLKAQNEYHEAKTKSLLADENMAFLLADEVGTKYFIEETLNYQTIRISIDDSLAFLEKNNSHLLTNKTLIENAERSYDLALKENLPLPKFTVNLGAYTKNFGPTSSTSSYETYGGSKNLELVASINATWSLTGEDGFLNSNKVATSRINKEIAIKEFEKTNHYAKSLLRQTYQLIISYQNQIIILEARIKNLQKSFDTILDNYLNNKTKYQDFHSVFSEFISTKILLEEVRFNHLKEKLNLAKISGIEDFPGENFELLAIKIKK